MYIRFGTQIGTYKRNVFLDGNVEKVERFFIKVYFIALKNPIRIKKGRFCVNDPDLEILKFVILLALILNN